MTYKELKSKYKSVPAHLKVNKLDLPLNVLPQTEDGVAQFNEIIDLIHSMALDETTMTPSGGISLKGGWDYMDTYKVSATTSSIEIILLTDDFFRFEFRRNFKKEKKEVSGHRAFFKFSEICKKHGVDINTLRIPSDQGLKVKQSIPSPIIDMDETFTDMCVHNVHHIDIHSAHMAGVAEAFPELYGPINECYTRRKENETFKSIMTHTWGYMQSKYSPVYYQFSHLSKAGIESTNRKIRDLTERLEAAGRTVIAHNTDGIWYEGEIYHGEGEGNALGEWSNDHTNCTFRAKSKGVYEYIENGKYTVVARGYYELDKIKPRDLWSWGDIYNTGKIYKWAYLPEEEKLVAEKGYN